MKIENSCSIVTGGSNGIGKAIVKLLVSRGGNVVIGDILDQDGQKLADELNKSGKKRAVYVHCDVTDIDQLENLFKVSAEEFGGAQILFNNAGIQGGHNTVDDINLAIKIFETNLASVFQATLLAKKYFDQQYDKDSTKTFCIMITGSLGAMKPFIEFPIYSYTKNCLLNLTLIFSKLNWKNININSVAPSFVGTDSLKSDIEFSKSVEKRYGLIDPSFVAEKMLELIEGDCNGIVRLVEKDKVDDVPPIPVASLKEELSNSVD